LNAPEIPESSEFQKYELVEIPGVPVIPEISDSQQPPLEVVIRPPSFRVLIPREILNHP